MVKRIFIILGVLIISILFIKDIIDIKQNDIVFYNYINNGNIEDMRYIEIKRLGIKNIIEYSSKENLDRGYVVINKDKKNNTILAGHAKPSVFEKLYFIKKGDNVLLYLDGLNKYVVDYKFIVGVNEFSGFSFADKTLLITCTPGNKKRLIVVLKKL